MNNQSLLETDLNVYAQASSAKSAGSTQGEETVKTVQVFDKPMCCSTGICGPQVDPALPRFAAYLEWLKSQGHRVERYNLAQQPDAFIQNSDVHQLLATQGTACLPMIFVDGQIVSRCSYPSREALAGWTGARSAQSLPVVNPASQCCTGSSCC